MITKKIAILFLSLFILIACSKDSSADNQSKNIDKTSNLKTTGASAHDILANTTFDELQFEIAFVKNHRPTTEAIANLETFLEQRTFKQKISFSYNELSSPNETDLSLSEIAELESDNRTLYNSGKKLAIYIYFADAPSEEDDEDTGSVTLGAVYRNTSMVIFESTIKSLAAKSNLITEASIETATLHHEMGHLFGLVNIGTDMVNNHEDTEAENHCNVDGCLMRAELQFGGGVTKMLIANKNATANLDSECILDLQANGGR